MNVNISFSGQQEASDKGGEDTSFVSDAGTAPSSEVSISENETMDMVSSESETLDIGGPPDWLKQAMTSSSASEENVAEGDSGEDIEDGGSGPTE